MIGMLRHVFDELRRQYDEWTLFAVLQRRRKAVRHWDLVVAAPWLPDDSRSTDLEMILAKLDEVSTLDDRMDVGIILRLRDPIDVADAAAELLGGRPIDHPVGLVRRKNFDFRGRTLRRGHIWAANLPTAAAAAVPAA